ncbi:MAG: hypothetical protein ACFWT6_17835 [Virgibacillus proomii]
MEQFQSLKLKPVDKLTDAEVTIMKDIRDSVPKITADTKIQKTIPAGDIEKYLSGDYTEVGGYIAKAEDVGHIKNYDDSGDLQTGKNLSKELNFLKLLMVGKNL